mmetsp:Transcript_53072/g.128797  ORF Transcript_53072/g.128797 Transcript_53072/m.128797 type:complete len:638 (+) Transcript_53072:3-1916(+)
MRDGDDITEEVTRSSASSAIGSSSGGSSRIDIRLSRRQNQQSHRRRNSVVVNRIRAAALSVLLLVLVATYNSPCNHVHAFSSSSVSSSSLVSPTANMNRQQILTTAPSSSSSSRSSPTPFSRRISTPPSTVGSTRSNHMTMFSQLGGENNENDNDDNSSKIDYTKVKPQVVPQRWVQLAYLSLLALLSDWVCFSVAAAPTTFENSFPGHSASSIIDIFLFTNVLTSFLVTDIVAKFGLQRAIQGAALFMTAGVWLRAGIGFVPSFLDTTTTAATATGNPLVDYPFIIAGTICVGIAQPFFQCTPPLLSAKWFANNERSTSTAIALNFNQVGIATAFLIGGGMATTAGGLENYFGLIAIMTSLVTVGTLLQFQNEPPVPPSTSELEKLINDEEEPPFIESVKTFFSTKGFTRPLAAFICSITITNVVGAFIDDVMIRGGVNGQFQIDLAGAGFELAIVAGGIILGGYVDKTKEYKRVTMGCLAGTALLVLPLGLTDHALGREPLLLIMALLGLGLAAGPVQPINAELAVDVTFPGDETAVESVQQIGGNLVSALLIPIAEMASEKDYTLLRGVPGLESDIRGDVVLLIALAAITLVFFSGFDAPLARTASDEAESDDDDTADVVLDVAVQEEAIPARI